MYTTINSAPEFNLQIIYEELQQISSESYWEYQLNDYVKLVTTPPLHIYWLDDEEMEERKDIERLCYLFIYGKEISYLKLLSSSHFLDIFQIPKSNPPLE